MKNTFAVSMTLLLLATFAGSWIGYNRAMPKHEAAAHSAEAASEGATAEMPPHANEAANDAATAAPGEAAAQVNDTEGTPGSDVNTAADNVNGGATDAQTGETDAHAGAHMGAGESAGAGVAAASAADSASGDAEAGKNKFATSCAGCHGATAEGGIGPKLNVTKTWSLEQLTAAVREGKSPEKTLSAVMPHFTAEQLSDAEMANIHAFLKTLN